VPEGYTPSKAWPLLVALHGYGSGADPFHDLWQEATTDAGFVLATPQGTKPTSTGFGWAWAAGWEQVIQRSIDGLRGIVRVDPRRVYLAGFSQGGRLAYTFAARHPRAFCGIAMLGTPFERPDLPTGDELHSLAKLRVFIGHGSLEPNVRMARSEADALRKIGCCVQFAEYPGVGHGLPEPMSAELERILTFLECDGQSHRLE
jgi:phospholipase/carboxylesterase